jgi:hypothetical protein
MNAKEIEKIYLDAHVESRRAGNLEPVAHQAGLLAVVNEAQRPLREALEAKCKLYQKALDELNAWLPSGSEITDAECLHMLLGIFDGPEQRAVDAQVRAALAGGEGEGK